MNFIVHFGQSSKHLIIRILFAHSAKERDELFIKKYVKPGTTYM